MVKELILGKKKEKSMKANGNMVRCMGMVYCIGVMESITWEISIKTRNKDMEYILS